MKHLLFYPLLFAVLAAMSGCISVTHKIDQKEPIHVIVDVRVKVDRELEDFFGELDAQAATIVE